MMHDGHIWVRLSARLGSAMGLTYNELWRQVTSGRSGFTVLDVPTRNPRRTLRFLRLDEIHRALGHSLYEPPISVDANTRRSDHVDHEAPEAQ